MSSNLLIDIGPAVGGHGQRGIGRYVRGLAASIATFSNELANQVWAVGYPGSTLDSFGARGLTSAANRRLGWAPAWATGRLASGAALKSSGARVFHATDPQRPWIPGTVPSVVTVYDLIPLHEREMFLSWRFDQRLAYHWYLRQVNSATRILAISRATAEDLQERLGIAPELIDIVYPTVTPPPIVRRIQPPEPTFLFVGALDPHKQPELALRAFAQVRSRLGSGRMRYIGPSDQAQERRLHELAGRLGVTGSISIEGRVSDDDLENAYGSATALISTSRVEGFGLPPVEAALRGVPVIAVETAAAREALVGVAAIVPSDVEAIAEAMAHPIEPDELAVDGIRERYSIPNVARSLAESYGRILG